MNNYATVKEEPKFPIEGTKNAPVMDVGRGAGLPTGSAKLKFFRQKYIFFTKISGKVGENAMKI